MYFILMVVVKMSYSVSRTTTKEKKSVAKFVKLNYAHFRVKLSYAAQFTWVMLNIFHRIFSKFIKSSVLYFSIVCGLFALSYYLQCFCGLLIIF